MSYQNLNRKLEKPKDWPYNEAMNFFGAQAAQHTNIFDSFAEFKIELDKKGLIPKNIIEVGTLHGGFAVFLRLHEISQEADEIHTFNKEIQFRNNTADLINELGIICHYGNIFDGTFDQEIGKLVKREGLTLLFCDNGDKPREFNMLAKYLKPGDFIFAHDYFKDQATFEKNYKKLWDWFETPLKDLKLQENGVVQVYEEIFDKSVWFCGQKQLDSKT